LPRAARSKASKKTAKAEAELLKAQAELAREEARRLGEGSSTPDVRRASPWR